MAIPTEPIGSIPRPIELIEAGRELTVGRISAANYQEAVDWALRDTIALFEAGDHRR